MKKLTLLLLAYTLYCVESKTFLRCELVQELKKQGFPEAEINNWVCLVENESGRNTEKVGINRNGSRDYGLFQINDEFWCSKTDTPGKDCNVTCNELLTDDITVVITDITTCAKKVFKRHGFNAWYGWKDHCKGKKLPNTRSCSTSKISPEEERQSSRNKESFHTSFLPIPPPQNGRYF